MKLSIIAVAALLACRVCPVLAQEPAAGAAACEYREEALSTPDAAPAKASKITLLGVDPPDGGEVRKGTVLRVDVEFHIANFSPDHFHLGAGFPTLSLGTTSPGKRSDFPHLKTAAGKVHLCVPLVELYDDKRVQWPLSMVVNIHEETDTFGAIGSSRVLASTNKVKFNSPDIPAGALERQAEAPPVEYHEALLKAFGYFEYRAAMYKVCIQHYADMQAAFTKGYRRWEARHADDIAFINERQFDNIKLSVKNNMQVATKVFDLSREMTTRHVEAMPDNERRPVCRMTLSELQDPEDNTQVVVGEELQIVREWHSSRVKLSPPQ